VIPASLRRPRGGRLSVPLAALLVLIVLVVIGSLVARSRDSGSNGLGPGADVVLHHALSASATVQGTESGFAPLAGGMIAAPRQHITTEGWNW
jgi:hypothetical protein